MKLLTKPRTSRCTAEVVALCCAKASRLVSPSALAAHWTTGG